MNPIFSALASGYSAAQIIKFIQSMIPDLTPKINAAKKQGYTADKIVEFLSDTMQREGDRSYQTSNRIAAKKREENKEFTKDLLKQGIKLGITGLGASALSKLAPSFGRQLPNPIQPTIPNNSQVIPNQSPNPPNPTPQAAPQQPGPNIGQQIGQQAASPVTQAIQPNTNIPIPSTQQNEIQIPNNLLSVIDRVRNAGNNPEQVEGYLQKFHPKEASQFEKESGKPIRESIKKHFDKTPIRKEESNRTVLLPDGNIGEIEDVKQGIAKVKVGDKIRNKKLSELMESPKEAANAALELIKSFTPEHHRSAHHALNMYDPNTRSAQFLFHNGEGYVIDDISPEEYERLSKELDTAKTTGETKIGAWATGAGSRGAAYQKIVKNLKKPYRKVQVGYNLFKEFQRLINEKEE